MLSGRRFRALWTATTHGARMASRYEIFGHVDLRIGAAGSATMATSEAASRRFQAPCATTSGTPKNHPKDIASPLSPCGCSFSGNSGKVPSELGESGAEAISELEARGKAPPRKRRNRHLWLSWPIPPFFISSDGQRRSPHQHTLQGGR